MLRRVCRAVRRGWGRPRWINRLLYPLSLVYAGLMGARRQAARRGLLRRHKLPVPVVVVGNISVGGVGKTPLVIELAEQFRRRGMKPGIVTRGYRGRSTVWPREVGDGVTADEVGDEPVLIFRRCRAPVVAGPDRVHGARLLVNKHGCDVVLSDDGFQHLALARDLDIVVIDGERRFGNGWCLPAGPLREPPAVLAQAGIIVVNGAGGAGGCAAGPVPEYAMQVRVERAVRMNGAQSRPLGDFAGCLVHALAGIGNPGRFFRQLAEHGLRVTPHAYPDHHRFTPADFAWAADGAALLMTEKDAVKCEALALPPEVAARCWVVPLRAALGPGLLDAVFERVPSLRSCPRSTS